MRKEIFLMFTYEVTFSRSRNRKEENCFPQSDENRQQSEEAIFWKFRQEQIPKIRNMNVVWVQLNLKDLIQY